MGNATNKQIYFLKGKNIDASNMDFETASNLIAGFKTQPGASMPVNQSFERAISYGTEKKPFDTASYYVSYAKDICVALINKLDVEKGFNVEVLMQQSIKAVLDAKEAFK